MRRRDFLSAAALMLLGCRPHFGGLTIGSKNFTEQLILGELLAQYLEAAIKTAMDRRFYLAGTYICQQALLAGRIDLYVEYTGTALAAVLKEKAISGHQQVFDQVHRDYARRFNLKVMPPLGFDNSFALVMRRADADEKHLTKLSQLAPFAPQMRMGVGYEFLERPDGYKGLVAKYGLKFAEPPRVMDLGLLYRALESRQVDIVAGSNTDGLIAALNLVVLDDDLKYFPPYDAVPIVRPDALRRYASLEDSLNHLAGKINIQAMRQMNYAVDGQKQDAARVAREFLRTHNLLAS
ncbi:MAG TPA: glycine betaine ABC transporter substrate-binding protein [Terriglobales bacterium]|nr:glycine betaine ABC transporter substrate-binding protein [Terriglobales bacterium]